VTGFLARDAGDMGELIRPGGVRDRLDRRLCCRSIGESDAKTSSTSRPLASGQPSSDAHVPPGWSYNPSSWPERLPIIALAVVGFGIATYLALYQLGVTGSVWEPFFGSGSRRILTSEISRILPFPDATLGALGYLVDAVSGAVGGAARWRTMPWIVIIFGLAVGPFGAVSVLLVIAQPLRVHAWCTLCLASAIVSVLMIGPAMDELLASLQHLRRERSLGHSVWRAFWGAAR
jgi:uncharacterized membrane protein